MRFRFLSSNSAVALCLFFLLAACSARPPLQTNDPGVQAARAACRGIPEADRFACIEQQAVAALNPDVCRLLGIAVDDACLQAVYEAADDPAICDRLYLPGAVPACRDYYATAEALSPLPSPTPTPTLRQLQEAYEKPLPAAFQHFFAAHAGASLPEMQAALHQLIETDPPDDGIQLLAVHEVENSSAIGIPALSLFWQEDCASCPMVRVHALAWLDPQQEAWRYQTFFGRAPVDVSAIRATADEDGVFLAVIANPCAMSTMGYCEIAHLYRYSPGWWEWIWYDDAWNPSLAQASFVGDGIDTLAVRYSDFDLPDAKSRIILNNHGGLHRWFNETWQRHGEGYVLVDRQVEASPYNTLVEFFHALKTGGDTASWVASQQVLDGLVAFGRTSPFTSSITNRGLRDDDQRFVYRERHDARFDRSGAWYEGTPGPLLVYDLESGTSSPWAGALEDLVVQLCAISDCVAPLAERYYAHSGWLYLPGNYNAVLPSPDGRWVALVVRHIYGPEDLVVVRSAELPSLPRDGNSGERTNPSPTS